MCDAVWELRVALQSYKRLGTKIYLIFFDFTPGLSSGLRLAYKLLYDDDKNKYYSSCKIRCPWWKNGSKVLNFTWLYLVYTMIHKWEQNSHSQMRAVANSEFGHVFFMFIWSARVLVIDI